ncbi:MAG: right-handed parallel beta-helix repeat-containing protein, partial [Sedimentisphaerales bacterium]
IVVLDGTYTGDGNRDIDFNGRAITLKSVNGPESCIIECGGSSSHPHRGFYFHSGENSQSIVDGFTITGGWIGLYGGGIRCGYSSPTIRNCIISRNRASMGGGMYNDNSHPILINCTFESNYSVSAGGGMYNSYSNPVLTNCTFSQNSGVGVGMTSGGGMFNFNGNPTLINCIFDRNSMIGTHAGHGGGMYNWGGNPTLTNCIFTRNSAIGGEYTAYAGGLRNRQGNPILTNCIFYGNSTNDYCGGIYNSDGKPTLTNCILWGNSDTDGMDESAQIYTEGVGGPFINYSCIQGLDTFAGHGNIGEDPCFADSSNDDYHLKSLAGRWDANSQSWIQDDVNSPCIDAGDPNSDWTAELWPHGKRINMGAYGGTPEASMSQLDIGNIANLDNDVSDIVNPLDLALFVGKWCYEEFLLAEDLNRDGFVNFIDFAIFTDNCELPPQGPPPGPASNPAPANGATEVNPNADLSWTAGLYAMSHDVFFGTSNPPPFIHNQTATTFDPGTMAVSTMYYWRIDEVGAYGTTTGTVWRFTTLAPGPASNPAPANAATEVDPNADLSWTAGVHATSHDVFFGMRNPPPFIHNQTATTFEPGTMADSTMYYWRIDEVIAYGTTTGTVWRFTTLVPAHSATNPNPHDGQGGVTTTPVLSWTADPDATSHDVYFGTSNPPTFIRNQPDTTYEPGTLEMATTYYWRIDEV